MGNSDGLVDQPRIVRIATYFSDSPFLPKNLPVMDRLPFPYG
jgi:hypothetical protein